MSNDRVSPSALARRALDALLPHECLLCGALASSEAVCAECRDELPRLAAERCPICALPSVENQTCGSCLSAPPQFDATLALYAYEFPVDRMIQALKYQARLPLARYFGEQLAVFPAPAADCLIPMPLHPRRLRERGFNQAVEIARPLARRWRMAIDLRSARRAADTAPQADLALAARRRNVRGAFACDVDLEGRRVVLVDDVMTSGATLDELARVLKARGAAWVTNCVVARTLRE